MFRGVWGPPNFTARTISRRGCWHGRRGISPNYDDTCHPRRGGSPSEEPGTLRFCDARLLDIDKTRVLSNRDGGVSTPHPQGAPRAIHAWRLSLCGSPSPSFPNLATAAAARPRHIAAARSSPRWRAASPDHLMSWRPPSVSRAAIRRHVTLAYVRTPSRHERPFRAGASPALERGLIPYFSLTRNITATTLVPACQSTDLARPPISKTYCIRLSAGTRMWLASATSQGRRRITAPSAHPTSNVVMIHVTWPETEILCSFFSPPS